MSEEADEWADHFAALEDPDAQEWTLRRQCGYLVLNSVGHRDELEDEQALYLDPEEPYTIKELKNDLERLKMNQRHPLDCYHPGQKAMVKHFKMICGL